MLMLTGKYPMARNRYAASHICVGRYNILWQASDGTKHFLKLNLNRLHSNTLRREPQQIPRNEGPGEAVRRRTASPRSRDVLKTSF
jgi:hypothetical protein